MEIEYDNRKAKVNFKKHSVSFDEAATCFHDELALSIEDVYSRGESRWALIGMSVRARLITVVYTVRNDKIRIISARKSTKREIQDYAQRI